jgi:hypothetical protein
MKSTTECDERPDGRQLPGFHVDDLLPNIQRRAAEAALLRDRRLELAIDADGVAQARMVDTRASGRDGDSA